MSLTIVDENSNLLPKRYGIIGIVGNRECGKSTYMVRRLVKEAKSRQRYKKVFCNLHVGSLIKDGVHAGPPGVQYIDYEDFMKIREPAPQGVPSALVGVDQIHRWFDARASGSKHNRETADHIVQSRQHGFDILTTTWGRSFVDLRLRRFYELLIQAERGRKAFLYDFIDPDSGPIGHKEMPVSIARAVWTYFDTAEEVLPPRDLKEKEARK